MKIMERFKRFFESRSDGEQLAMIVGYIILLFLLMYPVYLYDKNKIKGCNSPKFIQITPRRTYLYECKSGELIELATPICEAS